MHEDCSKPHFTALFRLFHIFCSFQRYKGAMTHLKIEYFNFRKCKHCNMNLAIKFVSDGVAPCGDDSQRFNKLIAFLILRWVVFPKRTPLCHFPHMTTAVPSVFFRFSSLWKFLNQSFSTSIRLLCEVMQHGALITS